MPHGTDFTYEKILERFLQIHYNYFLDNLFIKQTHLKYTIVLGCGIISLALNKIEQFLIQKDISAMAFVKIQK